MMMVAVSTLGAADSSRRASVIPSKFRETGLGQKTMPVAYTIVFLCHRLDHSVSRIERHQIHVIFLSHSSVTSRFLIRNKFHAALIRQELLSNIEQS